MESIPHSTVSFVRSADWWHRISSSPDVSFIRSADWWHGPVPHPAVSSTGRLLAVTFSPRPAVPAICRLLVAVTFSPHLAVSPIGRLVAVTFSPHQVFRPTRTYQPRITIPGTVHPARPVCPVTGPWPINHARLLGYWAQAIWPSPSTPSLPGDTGPWPSGHARPPYTAWILDSRLSRPAVSSVGTTALDTGSGCFLIGRDVQSPPG
jgi:hypothetical protein